MELWLVGSYITISHLSDSKTMSNSLRLRASRVMCVRDCVCACDTVGVCCARVARIACACCSLATARWASRLQRQARQASKAGRQCGRHQHEALTS